MQTGTSPTVSEGSPFSSMKYFRECLRLAFLASLTVGLVHAQPRN